MVLAYCDEKYVDEVLKKCNNICSKLANYEFCNVLEFRYRNICIDFLKQEIKNMRHDKNISLFRK